MSVTLNNKETFTFQADYALGEPELPMMIEDFCAKTSELGMSAGKSDDEMKQIIDMILTFDGNVAELMKKLA